MPQQDADKKRKKKNKEKTNWGAETAHGFMIVGKVTGKIITWTLNIIMTILLIGLITGTIVGIVFLVYVNNYIEVDMSNFASLTSEQDMTTRLYYMDYSDRTNRIGTPVEIEDQQLFSNENRTWVKYDDIPTYLIEAFVSIEDERFWDHQGVDWKRTLGAAFANVSGSGSFGGSTITQQLIKNITGDNEVTIQRKLKEILSALDLEKVCTKEEIIEMYLNTIYLSEHCYGIQSAATAYFGKDVSDLTLAECAALASIPKYPTKYDPYLNPDNNKKRRNDQVLYKMHELGKITDQEFDEAYNTDLVINESIEQATTVATTSWYTDAVIEDAVSLLMDTFGWTEQIATQKVYTGGYNIYTVMDPDIQNIMEEYFKNDDNFDRINNGVQPESSMIIIDPNTGDILGIAGGRGEKTQSRVLNYATQTTRSPGSSMKPVGVYGPALEYGLIGYNTVYNDSPFYKKWPVNYPAGYGGPTTIHDAVRRSVNTVAVKVLNDLGLERSYDFVHNKLEMTSVIDEYVTKSGEVLTDKNLSALGLGGMTFGVTLREITSAYQIFANRGIFNGSRTIIKILDSEGNVIVDNSCKNEIVMSEENSNVMTKMLKEVVSTGTASKLKLKSKIDCAGKTGTTSDDNDRWFIGYTPYYLAGAWFGYEMPMALTGFSETKSPALNVWDDVMALVHQHIFDAVAAGTMTLDKLDSSTGSGGGTSNGLKKITVCSESGLLCNDGCTPTTAYFDEDSVPTKHCNIHSDTSAAETSETTSDNETTTKPKSTTETTTKAPETTTATAAPVETTTAQPPETTSLPETAPPETIVTTSPPTTSVALAA